MSTAIMSKAWPLKMPPTPKSVLISLSDNANDGGHCWPSLDTIAVRTCFSKRAVIDAIKWLELNGYISADRSNGRHTTYKLAYNDWQTIAAEMSKTGANDAPVQDAHPCSSRKNNDEPVHLPPKPVREVHSNRNEPSLKATVIEAQAPAIQKTRPSKKAPSDFKPTKEMLDWAKKEAPTINAHAETEKFIDHTFATARTDWVGTWRNWIRNAQKFAGGSAAQKPVVDTWAGRDI
jgi:hypothetical protein